MGEARAFRLADVIRPGDRVLVAQGCAEPPTLAAGLIAAHGEVGPFETFVGPLFSRAFDGAAEAGMKFASYGAMGRAAVLMRAGALDIWPLHYSELAAGFASGALRADVVLLHLARTPDGRLAATLANDYAVLAARHARCVIAEVNAQAPWCRGAELEADVRIDVMVESDLPPVMLAAPPLGPAELAVGRHVAGLIGDDATLQVGIGALPDAILSSLKDHRRLGVHSGLIGDGVAALAEAGVITGEAKSRDAGVIVTNTAFGTEALFRFLHGNPAVRLAPPAYTHDHAVCASQAGLVAINSALEVDLAGNVNAERIDGQPVGGTGGLVDFMRAARSSAGGLAVTVLRATDRTGKISRIVPTAAAVTAPKSEVDVVVTEYGVAHLRRLGARARAEALIAIAPPHAREDLARAARDGVA